MKIPRMVVTLIAFSWLAGASSVSAEPQDNYHPEDSYHIAVILPLSGPVASLGQSLREGIALRHESLPEEVRRKVRLSYEDDQFDPAQTVTAYRRLSATDRFDAVFVLGSPPANALSPIVEKEKKILVAIGASDPTIAVGKSYSFIHWVIPPSLGEVLADELVRRNLQRIGIIGAEASGSLADIDAAVASLKKRNEEHRIQYRETFPIDQTDYRTTIEKLRQSSVDGVVVVLFPGALSSFAKQFRQAGLGAELIGMETFEDETELTAAEGALEGAWYVNASDPTPSFIERYQARYGKHPGWAASNAYDSLDLLVDGVQRFGPENEAIRKHLASVKDYQGASGPFSASGDNRFTLSATLKQIQDGKFVALSARP
ncbi:MAG: ABC transporter substrate-binding protein [Bdellovibrionales bacterium]|nr:ABC transporter substrate-binding protein [Bdellovibrionales bacterium]